MPNVFLLFNFFWLCRVFVAVCGFSLVVANRGYSLAVMHGRLITVASLVAEHGLYGMQASVTTSCMSCKATGSVVVAHELSCPSVCGIFPNQGSNPYPLHWLADKSATGSPEKSPSGFWSYCLRNSQATLTDPQLRNKRWPSGAYLLIIREVLFLYFLLAPTWFTYLTPQYLNIISCILLPIILFSREIMSSISIASLQT